MKITRRQLRQIIAETSHSDKVLVPDDVDDIKALRNAITNLEAKVEFLLKNFAGKDHEHETSKGTS